MRRGWRLPLPDYDGLRPMWSTGTAGLMGAFPVLSGIRCLTLIADNDESRAGEIAARKAQLRWLQAGYEAQVFRPNRLGDVNDVLFEATPNER